MTSNSLKTFGKYLLIISVTVLLTWLSLRGLKTEEGSDRWEYILSTWEQASKPWLLIMAGLAIGSHIVRAIRWKMLLSSMGYQVKGMNTFLSLMVGYLVNLAVPRGGELSRCYNLYKLNQTPVDVSFGTVVVERIADLICLVALLVMAFALEAGNLNRFFDSLPWDTIQQTGVSLLLLLLGVGVVGLLAVALILYKSTKIRTWLNKFWQGIKKGLLSVVHLRQRGLFVAYSILIWVLYFLMSYAVIKAFHATDHLGFSAVISLFAIGSVAMALPLPGGTGSYHVLVPQGLIMLYAIPRPQAVAFTFIFHGWQTIIMIVGGLLALLVTFMLTRIRRIA